MPELKTYDLFISHAWEYNSDYYTLEKMLTEASNFKWRNYSVPLHDPVINPSSSSGKSTLENLLDNQVRPVNCVIILGGMYAAYSEWIQKEIQIAIAYKKPILGIYPFGQSNMPVTIQDNASKIVRWNTDSIIDAIREISL